MVVTTLNRSPVAGALAIGAAEHVFGLVPRGTHEYGKFLTPGELTAALQQCSTDGTTVRVDQPLALHYDPVGGRWSFWDAVMEPSALGNPLARCVASVVHRFGAANTAATLPDWAIINYAVIAKKLPATPTANVAPTTV